MIGYQKWGAHREIHLNLYESIIRSKLDYGCTGHWNARPTLLRILHPVQNAAIKISIGAFHNSPNASLLCEADEPNSIMAQTKKYNPTFNKLFKIENNKLILPNKIYILQQIIDHFN